jgi:hypothetical protein
MAFKEHCGDLERKEKNKVSTVIISKRVKLHPSAPHTYSLIIIIKCEIGLCIKERVCDASAKFLPLNMIPASIIYHLIITIKAIP